MRGMFIYFRRSDVPVAAAGTFFMTLAALGSPVQTYLMGKVFGLLAKFLVGEITKSHFVARVRVFCGIMMACGAGKLLFTWFGITIWLIEGENQQLRARKNIFDILLAQPMQWFTEKENLMGTIAQANRSVEEIRSGASEDIALLIDLIASVMFLFLNAMAQSWSLTLVIMASTPLMGVVSYALGKTTAKYAKHENDASARASKILNWSFCSGALVRTLHGKFFDMAKFSIAVESSATAFHKMALAISANSSILRVISHIVFVQGFWFGNHLVSLGKIQIANVFTAFSSCLLIGAQVANFAEILAFMNKALAAARTVRESGLADPPKVVESMDVEKVLPCQSLQATNVGFTYPGASKPSIIEASLELSTRTLNFIVGHSGSGKSTLLLLLMNFYDPSDGQISIDGVQLAVLGSEWVSKNFALVELSAVVFDQLLADNVRLGTEHCDDSLIKEALEAVCFDYKEYQDIHKFVSSSSLSGGQAQKVVLARAYVKNPPVLILDEALSAIDVSARRQIYHSIKFRRRGLLTIIVTHDMLAISSGDQVVMLEAGRVVTDDKTREGFVDQKRNVVETSEKVFATENADEVSAISDDYLHNPAILKDLEMLSPGAPELLADSIFRVLQFCAKTCPYRALIIFGVFLAVAGGVLTPVLSSYIAKLMSTLMSSATGVPGTNRKMVTYSAVVIGIAFSDGICTFGSKYILQYALEMWVVKLRKDALGVISDQDMNFFGTDFSRPAELSALLMNDSRDLRAFVSEFSSAATSVVALTLVGVVWALVSGWKLALVGIAFVPLVIVVTILFLLFLVRYETRYKNQVAITENFCHNAILGIKTVKGFGMAHQLSERYKILLVQLRHKGLARAILTGFGFALELMCSGIAVATIIYFGMYLISQGTYSQARMLEVLTVLTFTLTSASTLMKQIPDIARGQRAGTLFKRLLVRAPLNVENGGEVKHFACKGGPCIEFRNVDFSHSDSSNFAFKPVLRKLNLIVSETGTVCLVGRSGCGKSTIALLIARHFAADSGQVEIDGVGATEYLPDFYRSSVTVVPQNPKCFEGTYWDNLVYGLSQSNVSQEWVWECLRACQILDTLIQLPDGLFSNIGEDVSSKLSSGQLQRFCIARALIRKPRVIVFDECTSHLDSANTELIGEFMTGGIRRLLPEVTVVIITHEIAIMKKVPTLCMIEEGRVVETGSHGNLMEKQDAFYRFVAHEN